MADKDDPRQKGFGIALRPDPARNQGRRGIPGPPPAKPSIAQPAPEQPQPEPAAVATPLIEPGQNEAAGRGSTAGPKTLKGAQRLLGTARHNMRYVQFQATPAVSDLLTKRAEEEDLVLGEVVMAALRAMDTPPPTHPVVRRRRRSAAAVRRSILVRPEEAEEIGALADRLGYSPSALIRIALERYLLGQGPTEGMSRLSLPH